MWQIEEHVRVERQLRGAALEILKRYEKWKDIAMLSGPQGLRGIRGLRDEALRGEWSGHRSSRLGLQFRVIYLIVPSKQLFRVLEVTPHDYRRRS